uniref:Uncharacterized protein n=1 Tax=Catagonus wagneri TaxID=51154 RepID=A0A8C3YGP5_9CETA
MQKRKSRTWRTDFGVWGPYLPAPSLFISKGVWIIIMSQKLSCIHSSSCLPSWNLQSLRISSVMWECKCQCECVES